MNMENKEQLEYMTVENQDQIAIPLSIDETLLVNPSQSDVLQGLVQHQLEAELGIDGRSAEGSKMISIVAGALSHMLQEHHSLAFELDQTLQPKKNLH